MIEESNESPLKAIAVANLQPTVDCLLVSCSDLVPIFEQLKLKSDESFLEESAINQVQRSLKKQKSGQAACYKFIFVDLDDPTLLPGRFMASLNKMLESSDGVKMEVFACRSSSSDRILKMCKEHGMTFLPKPLTVDKLKAALKKYL